MGSRSRGIEMAFIILAKDISFIVFDWENMSFIEKMVSSMAGDHAKSCFFGSDI